MTFPYGGSASGITVAADLPPEVQGYYDLKALIRVKPKLLAYQFAQKKPLPEGKGSTVNFWRYAPLAVQTTALTEVDDLGLDPTTRQTISEQEVSAIPIKYGDYVQISDLAQRRSIDQSTEQRVEVVADQAGQSIDQIIHTVYAQGIQRMRADANPSYYIPDTLGLTTAAGSTVTLVDSASAANAGNAVDSQFVGGWITVTDPTSPAYGQTGFITGYVAATGTFTISAGTAFSAAPGSGVKYSVCVGTGIGAQGTIINSIAVRRVVLQLQNNMAQPYGGMYYEAILNPNTHFDFMDDPDFKKCAIFKDSKDNLEQNTIGTFAGVKFHNATWTFRESVAGVAAFKTGAVEVIPFFGKEALGCVDLGGGGGGDKGRQNFKTYVRSWQQLGQPLPSYGTIGWMGLFKAVVLNGTYGIGLMTGRS